MKNYALTSGFIALVATMCVSFAFAGAEQEFDAAYRSGKPLSAEAAYLKLVKENAKVAPIVHYRAAEVARWRCQGLQVRDRLSLFLRQEKGWSPEVENALWRLVATGDNIDHFRRLASKVPATDAFLRADGLAMFQRFVDARRFLQAFQMGAALIDTFGKDEKLVNFVFDRLNWLCDVSRKATFPVDEIKAFLEKYAYPKNGYWRSLVISYGFADLDWVLDETVRLKEPIPDLTWRAIDSINNNRYNEAKTPEAEKTAIEIRARKLAKAKDAIFAGDQQIALQYCAMTAYQPKLFFTDLTTNGTSVASAKLLEEALLRPVPKHQKASCDSRRWDVITRFVNWNRWSKKTLATFVDRHPEFVSTDWIVRYSTLGEVYELARKEKSPKPVEQLCQKFPKQADAIRRWCSSIYTEWGEASAVEKMALRDLTQGVVSFDAGSVLSLLNNCAALKPEQKVAVLKKGFAVSGYNAGWAEMQKLLESKRCGALGKEAAFTSFVSGLSKTAAAQDPLVREAWKATQTKDPAEALACFKRGAAAYPARYPDESQTAQHNAAFGSLLDRTLKVFSDSKDAKPEMRAELVKEILKKVGDEYVVDNWGLNHLVGKSGAEGWLAHRHFLQDFRENRDALCEARAPKDAEMPYPDVDQSKMSPWANQSYVWGNYDNLKPAGRLKLVTDCINARPISDFVDFDSFFNWFLDRVAQLAADPSFASQLPLKKLTDDLLAAAPSSKPCLDRVPALLRIAFVAKRYDEVYKAFVAAAEKAEPSLRVYLYAAHLQNQVNGTWLVDDRNDPAKNRTDMLGTFLAERFVPALKATSLNTAPKAPFSLYYLFSRMNGWGGYLKYVREKDTRNDKAIAAVNDMAAQLRRLYLMGLPRVTSVGSEGEFFAAACEDALAKGDEMQLARIAGLTAQSVGGEMGVQRYLKLVNNVKEKGFYEPLFLLVSTLPADCSAEFLTPANKIRVAISGKIPGVYPVDEKDPTFPLYVAADELARQNPERAWKILQEKNNLTVFEREAVNLPTPFVIWGVEQLRIGRGEKDEMLLKAKQIATYLLSQESKITPDLAAAMILTRAECFRDQQNFEAAKLEYQSIRDNPNYQRTPSGRKAMFRSVDLQISIGNAQSQESTLEYWLSQPDKEVQAQAHYFMAKIAFDRKDYDECYKQLKTVFQLDLTHTEGRFLEGQWKLATNREVDETEVIVGSVGDRTIIRPGQQLSVTVNDSNLSVAGGGSSIPIVVKTEPGGDVERIQLFPGTRDPSEFKGSIEVELGKAVVSNRTLQVTGADTVSYFIDPAYLKLRGLPLNEPKRLKVVDDAKMAIGAGAPKVSSEKAAAEVKAMMEGAAGGSRQLRPGNPIYVVVQDRDRSLGGEADIVRVNVKTTSGDLLEGVELKEEKPFTGVFRTKIDTALPPPRAYASDTAAGMNAGDAINSTKSTPWKSVADSKPGKWFAADTMGSYLVSNVTLKTPSVGDIKAIRLKGFIAGNEYDLASLPARKAEQATGLKLQRNYGKFGRDPKAIRAFFQTDAAGKPTVMTNLAYNVINPNGRDVQAGYFSGVFKLAEGYDNLRLRVVAKNMKGRTFGNLWLSVVVDGTELLSGQGEGLHNRIASLDLEPGCHRFEAFVTAYSADDAFMLLWEPYGEDARPLPADWFDAAKNPEIVEYLKEPATIEQTKEGFVATFQKPIRLRTLRWDFVDVKSPDVAVEKMSVTDTDGQQVLPVASDFSDAQHNETLEVAPGDNIVVQYVDEVTPRGQKRVIERSMASSFNNGSVGFTYEVPAKNGLQSCKAYRFQPGDSLVMSVRDTDCDLTDAADKVKVKIVTSRGETFEKLLLEMREGGSADSEGVHSGVFKGLLKTCEVGNTNAPASVMRVLPTDQLKVVYLDRENTSPGVPTERTDEVQGVRKTTPELTLFHTRDRLVPDTSADAQAQLERIRRRPGNENVSVVWTKVAEGEAMTKEESASTNDIPANITAPIPLCVTDPSRARHSASVIRGDAVAQSELDAAAAEDREPERLPIVLSLGGSLGVSNLKGACPGGREAIRAGAFNGCVPLMLGTPDANADYSGSAAKAVSVSGSDTVVVRIFDEDNQPMMERRFKLVSNASLGLTDSTFDAERMAAHVGEKFFVKVVDPDRDATPEADRVVVTAKSSQSGVSRKIVLTETMPHSGVFTGGLRPVMFAPGETVPAVATGGVATVTEALADDRFAVKYGDQVIFSYDDKTTLPKTPMPRVLSATGTVFRGANGSVRMFSKRFRDRDTAVLVQFRLAECLFEQAKDFRKLKKADKSAEAIAEGKFILEEALKNYPDSSHVVQGEFLLANLYQELGMEQKEAAKEDETALPKARALFAEALSRFSQILSTWPDGEFAARSQYHKAFCLEQLEEYSRASEEYVKMTYLFPESELVGEATIRLATYYYTKEKKYSVAGHIYQNFQQRFPQHSKAARALFMAGSCYIKQAETLTEEIAKAKAAKKPAPTLASGMSMKDLYREAVVTLDRLVEEYRDAAPPKLKAQALYWAGDVSCRSGDYAKAYQYLKRTTFEYPDTEWARRARGLLLQEGEAFKAFE